jgi:hypothetical protein
MSLFDRFLNTISVLSPSLLSDKNALLLTTIDPHKIYVENVRSVLGVSYAEALRILETAVRQQVFEKRVEVLCPDGTVAASASKEEELPQNVCCWTEEDGVPEKESFPTASLKKVTWYRLNEHSTDNTLQRTA